jgi:hypothetical protein
MARWRIRLKQGDFEKTSVMDGPATEEHARAVFEYEQANGHRPKGEFTVEPAPDAPMSDAAKKLFDAARKREPIHQG